MSDTFSYYLTVKRQLLNIAFSFLAVTFLFPVSQVSAQEAMQDIPSSQTSSIEREYQFLKEQTTDFRNFIQEERQQHQQFLETTIKYLGGLLAVATVFGLGSYWSALQDAKKVGVKGVAKAIRENEEEVRDILEETATRIFNEKLNFSKKILAIVESSGDFSQGELEGLKRRGFTNIENGKYSADLDLASVATIVFSYKPNKDKLLAEIADRLIKEQSNVPLIVYYAGKVDNKKLESYPWRGYANSPLTLVNAVFTAVNTRPWG